MTYQSNINLDEIIGIDVHVHAGISAAAKEQQLAVPEGPGGTLAEMQKRSGAGGQTPDETAAWYRERKIACCI